MEVEIRMRHRDPNDPAILAQWTVAITFILQLPHRNGGWYDYPMFPWLDRH